MVRSYRIAKKYGFSIFPRENLATPHRLNPDWAYFWVFCSHNRPLLTNKISDPYLCYFFCYWRSRKFTSCFLKQDSDFSENLYTPLMLVVRWTNFGYFHEKSKIWPKIWAKNRFSAYFHNTGLLLYIRAVYKGYINYLYQYAVCGLFVNVTIEFSCS